VLPVRRCCPSVGAARPSVLPVRRCCPSVGAARPSVLPVRPCRPCRPCRRCCRYRPCGPVPSVLPVLPRADGAAPCRPCRPCRGDAGCVANPPGAARVRLGVAALAAARTGEAVHRTSPTSPPTGQARACPRTLATRRPAGLGGGGVILPTPTTPIARAARARIRAPPSGTDPAVAAAPPTVGPWRTGCRARRRGPATRRRDRPSPHPGRSPGIRARIGSVDAGGRRRPAELRTPRPPPPIACRVGAAGRRPGPGRRNAHPR
jgi:hypothetical protein